MRETAAEDTPPPQSGAARDADEGARDRSTGSTRSRATTHGTSRRDDPPAGAEGRHGPLTPRERAERWPLG